MHVGRGSDGPAQFRRGLLGLAPGPRFGHDHDRVRASVGAGTPDPARDREVNELCRSCSGREACGLECRRKPRRTAEPPGSAGRKKRVHTGKVTRVVAADPGFCGISGQLPGMRA